MDLIIFRAINGWCGTPLLDAIAHGADQLALFKGGITIAALLYFWHCRENQPRTREIIIATMLAMVLAILISRVLAVALPFRVRPMFAMADYHAPSTQLLFNFENWSSFPSDHAAMWFALSYGIWRLSRIAGIVAAVYSALWICLVRLYFGIHYPSDLMAGALIGIGSGWIVVRMRLSRVTKPILTMEQRYPHLFYPVFFLWNFEIANIFDDLRRSVLHGLRLLHGQHLMMVFGTSVGLVLVLSMLVYRWYERTRTLNRPESRSAGPPISAISPEDSPL